MPPKHPMQVLRAYGLHRAREAMTEPAITSPTVLLQRMAPLLRSIMTELGERSAANDALALRIAAVRRARRSSSALLASLEARAAVHEREMRLTRAELLRLGWQIDEHDAARLVYVGHGGAELAGPRLGPAAADSPSG